jgi:myo-inositol-1(or 4)-monophosphatase
MIEKVLSQREEIEKFIINLVDSSLINRNDKEVIIHKDEVDISTRQDIEIEKKFHDYILDLFPECGFQGEEDQSLNKDGKYKWVIDPIDGTKYYHADVPLWSTTVSLLKGNEPIYGIIYQPTTGDVYVAFKGKGAYRNGVKMNISKNNNVSKSQLLLDIGIYSNDLNNIINKLFNASYRLRILGCGALSTAWVANGMFGAFINIAENPNKFIDKAAGLLLITESGGKYSIIESNGLITIIAGVSEIVDDVLKLL